MTEVLERLVVVIIFMFVNEEFNIMILVRLPNGLCHHSRCTKWFEKAISLSIRDMSARTHISHPSIGLRILCVLYFIPRYHADGASKIAMESEACG